MNVYLALLTQRPYYNTHIKMHGQDLEGWSSRPPATPRQTLFQPLALNAFVYTRPGQNKFFMLPWN